MLFTKEFVDECSSQPGSNMYLEKYMEEEGLSFHDSVLKISEMFGLEPKYFKKGDKPIPLPESFWSDLKSSLEEQC